MAGYVGRDAVIVGAVRTPIGKGKANGALHDVLPVDLLAHSLTELVARTGVDPARDRRRDRRRRHAGRRPGRQHRPQCVTRRRFPRVGTGHDRRPPVRQQPAGDQFRRAGRDLRRIRHRGRRGRRVDGPGADGLERVAGQRPVRRDGAALPRRPCAAGHQRRIDRREVGLLAATARRVLGGKPRKGRRGNQRGALRQGVDRRSPGWRPTRSSGRARRSRRWPA